MPPHIKSETQVLLKPSQPQSPEPVSQWRCYYELTRLHKFPLGNILIIIPSVWGVSMAAYDQNLALKSFLVQTAMFTIGSTLLHSSACVINDICDVDLDRQVERTKNRPLVTGKISMKGAWLLLFALTVTTMSMLLFTNNTAAILGLFGIFPLHALYPLMKRWTYWPQAWLGLAMNWGIPVAWASVTGDINWRVVSVLFAGTICWTIVYDTEYACQDVVDDIKVGIKSTAVLFGSSVREIVMVFALVFVTLLAFAGFLNNQGPAFFVISIGGAILYFAWQFTTWKVEDPNNCGEMFKSHAYLGYTVWAGLLVDYYILKTTI